jgi:dihydroorotate dehydrogenase
VGVGTALFVDPRKPVELAHGLAAWLREQRASRVADLVGAMEG